MSYSSECTQDLHYNDTPANNSNEAPGPKRARETERRMGQVHTGNRCQLWCFVVVAAVWAVVVVVVLEEVVVVVVLA